LNVRFQKTAKGEVAILPRAEYEALLSRAAEADEDRGTARIVSRARKEIATGTPLIPMEVVDRITAGENPVRALRRWRGMTQVELSASSHVVQGHISDIENGRRVGAAATLRSIAAALKVPLDLLVA
jgi:predicted transcriptional regulator